MSNKSLEFKLKWLTVGVLSGIMMFIFWPDLLTPSGFRRGQNSDLLRLKAHYKFAKYSQWPSFLTDPLFDLV
jgi:hypothetical protein